ncbi:Cytochrome c heme lyase subunit CcmL [Marinobacter nitratireducens]|uniref:Cytochrome c-type biogenesis protein n=1 Tax=Marinobacter nitratireducens TaxID=1137280 RepID=A0A072N4Q7_9GAMM|nr:cytochrome c-type biogenesis protein [Marinobacter nitratireducens]KEF31968.1 Cytochrome c heme lyase subunit CcmL [Marinobacter nitratireducens]
MLRALLAIGLVIVSTLSLAEVTDVYDFDSPQQEEQFQTMIEELRCPKCQNQNIADSHAPIAKDMRNEAYRMMQGGASRDEVVDALVDRFGEFILYKPAVEKRTFLLWATPVIAVFVGLLAVIGVVIRSRRNARSITELTPDEKARAEEFLADMEQEKRS